MPENMFAYHFVYSYHFVPQIIQLQVNMLNTIFHAVNLLVRITEETPGNIIEP